MPQRMVMGGLVGYATGMYWSKEEPTDRDIDADNDGVVEPVHEFQIDLSRLAARALGYQASMMKAYKIHRIKMGIRPVDDSYDNDSYASFGFLVDMYPATEHAFKALNLARKVENADESNQVDGDSLFLTNDNDYSGFRYGWNSTSDTPYATTGNGISGMHNEWVLSEIFEAYDSATAPTQSNALFGGRAPEQVSVAHVASWTAGPEADLQTGMSEYQCADSESYHSLEVLPLLRGQVKYSTGDEGGSVDDDYRVYFEIEFTPEVGGGF